MLHIISGMTASFGTVVILHYNNIMRNTSDTENTVMQEDLVEKLLGW